MLDHIDLERSARAASARQKKTSRGNIMTIGVLVAIVAFLLFVQFILPGIFSQRTAYNALLALLPDGTWHAAENVPIDASQVSVSPSGVVWISDYEKLSRFDGSAWQTYGAADWGTRSDYDTLFALTGEEVWGTSDAAVIHFDGGKWATFSGKISADGAIAIAANGPSVWVLDYSGQLTHYDGQDWSTAPLPPAPAAADYEYSTLATTPDGALWMTLGVLWRYDGQRWEAIPQSTIPADPTILTLARDRLWLSTPQGLAWISTDQTSSGQYSHADLDLAANDYVSGLTVHENQVWICTGSDIRALAGITWQPLTALGNNLAEPVAIAAAPDGALWASFRTPQGYVTTGPTNLPLLVGLLVVGLLLLVIFLFRPLLATWRQGRETGNARAVIRRALPDLPERNQIGANGVLFLYFVAITVFVNPLRPLIDRLFITLPFEVNIVIASLTWVTLLVLGKRLYNRARHPGVAFSTSLRADLASPLFVTVCLLCIVGGAEVLNQWLRDRGADAAITTVAYGACFLLIIFVVPRLFLRLFMGRYIRIAAALNNADYEQAERIALQLRSAQPRAAYPLYVHGTVLLFAGQIEEAEKLLREGLTEGVGQTPVRLLAATLNNLAAVLFDQKRYAEALPLYEAAAEIDPALDLPYLGVAELYLAQGENPERALQLLELARANKLHNMKADPHIWGAILACQGWAHTLLNQPDQAAALLQQALRETSTKSKPGLASVNYRVGRVLMLRGELAGAEEHLKQAALLDPHGWNAQRAAEALQELGASKAS